MKKTFLEWLRLPEKQKLLKNYHTFKFNGYPFMGKPFGYNNGGKVIFEHHGGNSIPCPIVRNPEWYDPDGNYNPFWKIGENLKHVMKRKV